MRLGAMEEKGRALAERVAKRTLAYLPISPSALTVFGSLLNLVVAALLSVGYVQWAAIVMFLAAGFDVADGALARVTRRESQLGAFLDSTLDRFSEVLVGLGLLIYFLRWGSWMDQLLLYLFICGSLLVSYVRARAEAQGYSNHAGLFTRPVRVILLGIGLLAGQLRITLWVMAVGVLLSALHRLFGVCMEDWRKNHPGRIPSWSRLKDRLAR